MKNLSKRSFRLMSAGIFLTLTILSGCSREDEEMNAFHDSTLPDAAVVAQQAHQFMPNELLVRFKTGTSEAARQQALGRVNGTIAEKILTNAMKHSGDNDGFFLVKTPLAAMDAIGRIKKGIEIEYAEPNYIYTTDAVADDPYFSNGSLWGMYGDGSAPANQYGSQAAEAWAAGKTGSSDIWVGIIDEGYMYTHVDLAANTGVNPGEVAGNGIDDDGNGYTDDVYGWDFDGRNNSVFDGTADDHGTHVAGTIGAAGNNKEGVAGVCWNVKLLNTKFLGKRGGTTANAVKAVDYFTDLKTRQGLNLVATNNSWGGGGFSQALQDAIERANVADILFIAAAGNSSRNIDASPNYPASYPNENIISVASITSTGGLSSFSNYGATQVDLGAPGSGIYSSVPVGAKGKIASGYASYNGTSMATPHVTGAVALYASIHTSATAAEIKSALLASVATTPSLSGKCTTGGRLDVSGF